MKNKVAKRSGVFGCVMRNNFAEINQEKLKKNFKSKRKIFLIGNAFSTMKKKTNKILIMNCNKN